MKAIDGRALTRAVLCGAAVVAAGLAAGPEIACATPLDDGVPGGLDGGIETIQWVAPPRRHWRRRRVWRCWRRRGRRVCGWVWV